MDLLNPFGITDVNGKRMLVAEDGTLSYYPITEQYKEGLKWLNKLYQEGIIDGSLHSGRYYDDGKGRIRTYPK